MESRMNHDTPNATLSPPIDTNISKGGYTWTKSELRKTLEESKDGKEKRHLLRSLLSNPGIGMERPTKIRKTQNGRRDSGIGPLLPEVIREYIGIGNKDSKNKPPDTNMNGNVSTDMDTITQNLQADLSEIANSRAKTQSLCDLVGGTSWRPQMSHDSSAGDRREKQNEILSYFVQPSSFVKLAYASQLYDRYIELHLGISEYQDQNQAHVMLKKLQNLAELDSQLCEVFVLILLVPLRRRTIAPLNENKNDPFWVESILSQSIDPLHYHVSRKSLDIIQTAVVDCLSSLVKDKRYVKVWELSPAVLIVSSKLYFPIAKKCIEALMEGAIISFEKVPSYVVEKVAESIDRKDATVPHSNDYQHNPMKVFEACTEILAEMATTCPCLKSLIINVATHIRDSENSKALNTISELLLE